MLRLIGLGSLVIVLAVPTITWLIRRQRKGRPASAGCQPVDVGGIEFVFVNGVAVVDAAKLTGALPSRVLTP